MATTATADGEPYRVDFGRIGSGGGAVASGSYQATTFASALPVGGEQTAGPYRAVSVLWVEDPVQGVQDVLLISPNGGEVLTGDHLISIEWQTGSETAGTAVEFELWKGEHKVAWLGVDWEPGGHNTASVYLPLMPEGDDYTIRIVSLWNPLLADRSDAPFSIEGGAVRVWLPNGGESWASGTVQWVHWQTSTAFAGTAVGVELWNESTLVADLGTSWDPDGGGVGECGRDGKGARAPALRPPPAESRPAHRARNAG
jgi:hypothetical protein